MFNTFTLMVGALTYDFEGIEFSPQHRSNLTNALFQKIFVIVLVLSGLVKVLLGQNRIRVFLLSSLSSGSEHRP